jgi:hypothetical protein
MSVKNSQIHEFLEAHPQLLIGREARKSADKSLEESDPVEYGFTFTAISKPVDYMVIYQTVHSRTKRALVAAALIRDQAAENDYQEQKSFADTQSKGCVCPEGNCDAWRLRCSVCAFANDEVCKWDRKSCAE